MRVYILNMNDLTINIVLRRLKVNCYENPHYTYTARSNRSPSNLKFQRIQNIAIFEYC